MPEPITIYQVRENYIYAEGEEEDLTVESHVLKHFQTIASAQLHLQELLNLKMAGRLEGLERYPKAFQSTPEALAAIAANKLHFDVSKYRIAYPEAFKNLPIFFIKEVTVYY